MHQHKAKPPIITSTCKQMEAREPIHITEATKDTREVSVVSVYSTATVHFDDHVLESMCLVGPANSTFGMLSMYS